VGCLPGRAAPEEGATICNDAATSRRVRQSRTRHCSIIYCNRFHPNLLRARCASASVPLHSPTDPSDRFERHPPVAPRTRGVRALKRATARSSIQRLGIGLPREPLRRRAVQLFRLDQGGE
jgi:hypothetical protein